jgi:hypothetical protein
MSRNENNTRSSVPFFQEKKTSPSDPNIMIFDLDRVIFMDPRDISNRYLSDLILQITKQLNFPASSVGLDPAQQNILLQHVKKSIYLIGDANYWKAIFTNPNTRFTIASRLYENYTWIIKALFKDIFGLNQTQIDNIGWVCCGSILKPNKSGFDNDPEWPGKKRHVTVAIEQLSPHITQQSIIGFSDDNEGNVQSVLAPTTPPLVHWARVYPYQHPEQLKQEHQVIAGFVHHGIIPQSMSKLVDTPIMLRSKL